MNAAHRCRWRNDRPASTPGGVCSLRGDPVSEGCHMSEQVRRSRRTQSHELRLGLLVLLAALAWAVLAPAHAHAASSITVRAHDLGDGSLLSKLTYLVNGDNTGDPTPA